MVSLRNSYFWWRRVFFFLGVIPTMGLEVPKSPNHALSAWSISSNHLNLKNMRNQNWSTGKLKPWSGSISLPAFCAGEIPLLPALLYLLQCEMLMLCSWILRSLHVSRFGLLQTYPELQLFQSAAACPTLCLICSLIVACCLSRWMITCESLDTLDYSFILLIVSHFFRIP